MKTDKLLILVRNISKLKYSANDLGNVDDFEQTLAKDLGLEPKEAMAMLGYLLKNEYARLVPGTGLVLNPSNEEIKKLMTGGKLNEW